MMFQLGESYMTYTHTFRPSLEEDEQEEAVTLLLLGYLFPSCRWMWRPHFLLDSQISLHSQNVTFMFAQGHYRDDSGFHEMTHTWHFLKALGFCRFYSHPCIAVNCIVLISITWDRSGRNLLTSNYPFQFSNTHVSLNFVLR